MKKLVFESNPTDVVGLPEILKNSLKKVFGFGFVEKIRQTDLPDYGILVAEKFSSQNYNVKKFSARCLYDFSSGNGWRCKVDGEWVQHACLQDWIKLFGKNTQWYIFETEKEMFEWMAQNC